MRHLRTTILTASLSLSCACGAFAQQPQPAPGAPAQRQPLQLKPHPLIAHLPDAQNCPVPDWIVPGMRLTYFTSVAQVNDAAGTSGLVEDPNGDIQSTDGRKFKMSSVGYGTGGSGWDCADIVAVEPGVVVIEMRSYFNSNGLQGPVTATGYNTVFVHPSGCDFFIHPRMLAQLQQTSGNGFSLIRGSMTHRGGNYNVLISSAESSGSRLVSAYDLASGVQLSHNSSSQHQGQQVFTPNADGSTYAPQNANSRTLANNQFHGARKITPPWPTMKIPEWAKTMKMMRYQGQRIDSGTPEMGLGRLVTNLTFEVSTAYIGKTFIAYTTQSTQQMEGLPAMDPVKGMMVNGCVAPGFWADPDCLKSLRAGQPIDNDPQVGVQATVEFVGADRSGRQVVVLASGNQLYKSTSTYDLATGRLIAMGRVEKSGSTGGTITTHFELTAMQ